MAIVDQLKKYYKQLPVQLVIVNERAAQIASDIYNAAIDSGIFAENEAFNSGYGPKLEKYIRYYDIGKYELACCDVKINKITTDNELLANRKFMAILEGLCKDAKLTAEDLICKEILFYATQKNERYDGMGFPQCLKGVNISPLGRILSISEYIARKYIDGNGKDQLIAKMKLKIGKKFDPDVVGLAIGVVEELYRRERELIPEPTEEFRSIQMLYQPVTDASGNVVQHNAGFICLNDKKQGTVMPALYVPVAEKNARMMEITKFGFEYLFYEVACSKFAPAEYARTFSVHVSAECLAKSSFVVYVKKLIREFAINPQRLIFDIDATTLDAHNTQVVESLKSFRELGIKLAMDNYGVDQGSLAKLQDLEFDIIKIDRSFIDQICSNRKTYEIVKNMIKMAKDLQITVVAKGVDTDQQKDMLLALKCFYMQGKLWGEPEPFSI